MYTKNRQICWFTWMQNINNTFYQHGKLPMHYAMCGIQYLTTCTKYVKFRQHLYTHYNLNIKKTSNFPLYLITSIYARTFKDGLVSSVTKQYRTKNEWNQKQNRKIWRICSTLIIKLLMYSTWNIYLLEFNKIRYSPIHNLQ